jgi:3-oxoacyl-[acyl-carrier protein] reductase
LKQHILVTGGSRGIGLAIVRQLLSHNYNVTTIFRTVTPQLAELQDQYRSELYTLQADLSKIDQLPAIVREINNDRPIFGLVNNAATAVSSLLVNTSPEEIELLITINLTATILLSRLIAKQMIRAHGGRIINISSSAASRAYRGLAAYSATKSGLDAFTRTLACELGPRNITVNAIAPGFVETDMSSSLLAEQREQILRRTPLRKLVSPDDIAGVVLFLLSPSAHMITGSIITVDGGASL